MPKIIVLTTGGYDPLHSGHIEYFRAAKKLGDILVVGLNSDDWLSRKKGQPFMPFNERTAIIDALGMVDHCVLFDDSDGTAIEAIKNVRQLYPNDQIIFANGGDRTASNIPEMTHVDYNLRFEFGVGGTNKINSSSWILKEWKAPKTQRQWGAYCVLHESSPRMKLKELTVDPGRNLSMQRHLNRQEFWFVIEGEATLYGADLKLVGRFTEFQHVWIHHQEWHQLCNETLNPLKIIEIQYGESCVETDIERR